MSTPRFRLDEDGEHVWWYHHCNHVGIQEDGTVAGCLPVEKGAMLPNGPWQLVSREPLHIEPSILCMSCGEHGFIRDGVWVPA